MCSLTEDVRPTVTTEVFSSQTIIGVVSELFIVFKSLTSYQWLCRESIFYLIISR
jgi:hypothetical protein